MTINKKLDIESYINENINLPKTSKDNILKKIHYIYSKNMEQKLKEEKIYITNCYIIISNNIEKNIDLESVENTLYKLNDIGCNVEKIKDEKLLKLLIFQSINKEYM